MSRVNVELLLYKSVSFSIYMYKLETNKKCVTNIQEAMRQDNNDVILREKLQQ